MSTTLERPTMTILEQPCCTPPGTPTVTEPDAETYAGWFKALADPTRIRILNLLATEPGTRLRLRHHRSLPAGPADDLPPPEGPA